MNADFENLFEQAVIPDVISAEYCRANSVVPLGLENNVLRLGIGPTTVFHAVDNIATLTGYPVKTEIFPKARLKELMDAFFYSRLNHPEQHSDVAVQVAQGLNPVDLSRTEPVVKAVNAILYEALKAGASDIHIQPSEQEVCVKLRVDGVLREVKKLPHHLLEGVVCRIKVMSNLDIAQSRVPQDGSMRVELMGREVDMRVSVIPACFGEDVSIRLLDRENFMLNVDSIGLEDNQLDVVKSMLASSKGVVFVTGPTGSGKTTSLYAFLQTLIGLGRNIITIEDPVEYKIPGITQIQVRPEAGFDFDQGLRSVLRHDPDIILVGEIRDAKTAKTAMQAALTGHLVLTTVHTMDTVSVPARLIDLGVEPYLVSAALRGMIAQRLVRKLCPACAGKGCAECFDSGFKGRCGIFEVVQVDDELQKAIAAGPESGKVGEYYRKKGISLLKDQAELKVSRGITSMLEAAAAVL